MDYQYDGFIIFFLSLEDSVNPVLSVRFVEHRSSMSLYGLTEAGEINFACIW